MQIWLTSLCRRPCMRRGLAGCSHGMGCCRPDSCREPALCKSPGHWCCCTSKHLNQGCPSANASTHAAWHAGQAQLQLPGGHPRVSRLVLLQRCHGTYDPACVPTVQGRCPQWASTPTQNSRPSLPGMAITRISPTGTDAVRRGASWMTSCPGLSRRAGALPSLAWSSSLTACPSRMRQLSGPLTTNLSTASKIAPRSCWSREQDHSMPVDLVLSTGAAGAMSKTTPCLPEMGSCHECKHECLMLRSRASCFFRGCAPTGPPLLCQQTSAAFLCWLSICVSICAVSLNSTATVYVHSMYATSAIVPHG